MPSASLIVRAIKAGAYFDSLCKHFARKVTVERDTHKAKVNFPMGLCHMSLDGEAMCFECSAEDARALEAVKIIIADHVVRYGELKDANLQWSDG